MVVRRLWIVLRVEQLGKGIFLCGVWKQSEEHTIHAEVRRYSAGVILHESQGMAVAVKGYPLFIVNELGDTVLRLRERRIRRVVGSLDSGGDVLRKKR